MKLLLKKIFTVNVNNKLFNNNELKKLFEINNIINKEEILKFFTSDNIINNYNKIFNKNKNLYLPLII